jgi:phosphoglycerate dehydrogenase-like enzyme
MNIVFHGMNAGSFAAGFAALLDAPHSITALPDTLDTPASRAAYAAADAVIGVKFDAACPAGPALKLYQVPGAGYDAVDLALLPPHAALCNVFEHEHAIAEYVMTALLLRTVDLPRADADLRRNIWTFWAGVADAAHDELRGKTIGLLGYGHIGKEVAARARAFGLKIHVCNRSPVDPTGIDPTGIDRAWTLDGLHDFMGAADFIVSSLPLLPDTAGLIDAAALAAMRTNAVILNVGRGGVIDEAALYDALKHRRIGGAVIDTWYRYPTGPGAEAAPGNFPFHELDNLTMTPHMSGWTRGTIARRQATMADNINRLARGEPLRNLVRPGTQA